MSDSFADLKVGDEVHTHNYMGERIEKVTGLTDKQIIVGKARYWKKNGRQVGGDKWGRSYLDIPTDEARKRIRKNLLAAYFNNRMDWNNLDLETLERVYAALMGEKK